MVRLLSESLTAKTRHRALLTVRCFFGCSLGERLFDHLIDPSSHGDAGGSGRAVDAGDEIIPDAGAVHVSSFPFETLVLKEPLSG